MIISVF